MPSLGPLVACNVGLGCDIQTNTCVSPCGGTGQVCCDGPETRAPKWTADGKVYSPNTWDMQEMCRAGACERQSHRCFDCGTADGQPCCPPDAAQATARCIGDRLSCNFDPNTFFERGTCIKCGIRGRPPCDYSGCDPGLDLLKGLCEIGGGEGQVPCDKGCKPPLGKVGGICRTCGGVNQIPCDNGCNPGLNVRQGLCVACGGANQGPCDKGCNPGLRSINGVCTPCGGLNQPPCNNGCNYPYRVAGGVCKPCGHLGQVPCDVGCDGGLVIINNVCSTPQRPSHQLALNSARRASQISWPASTAVSRRTPRLRCCASRRAARPASPAARYARRSATRPAARMVTCAGWMSKRRKRLADSPARSCRGPTLRRATACRWE